MTIDDNSSAKNNHAVELATPGYLDSELLLPEDSAGSRDTPSAVTNRSTREARRKYYRTGLVVVACVAFLAGIQVGVAMEKHTVGSVSSTVINGASTKVTTKERSSAAHVIAGTVYVNASVTYGDISDRGTGVVLTSDGLVVTNNHVIEGAASISVTDLGNQRTYQATVVGYDRIKDIAVLQLQGATNLQVAPLGNSSDIAMGGRVLTVGNAGGLDSTPSLTTGALVSTNQHITATNAAGVFGEALTGLLETSAGVVPGDSGGPVVAKDGKVVGIDVAAATTNVVNLASGGATVSYAIPIRTVKNITRSIVSGTTSPSVHVGPTAMLGVEVTIPTKTNDPAGAASHFAGALVALVEAGSPLSSSGLAPGDTITAVNGVAVTTTASLGGLMSTLRPGESVPVQWIDSSGASHTASVALGSGPPQ
jgi:S1-C subfamily serine protease